MTAGPPGSVWFNKCTKKKSDGSTNTSRETDGWKQLMHHLNHNIIISNRNNGSTPTLNKPELPCADFTHDVLRIILHM